MNQATEPAEVHAGLAVYRRGDGPPLLLFPYPHASGGGPMIDGALDLRLESFVAAGAARARSTHDESGRRPRRCPRLRTGSLAGDGPTTEDAACAGAAGCCGGCFDSRRLGQ